MLCFHTLRSATKLDVLLLSFRNLTPRLKALDKQLNPSIFLEHLVI